MAEKVAEKVVESLKDAVVENITDSKGAGSRKTPESLVAAGVAYSALFLMAVVPIYVGSFRSMKNHDDSKKKAKIDGEKPEGMVSEHDAMMFPVIASIALVSLYALFYFFGKEYVNLVLACYFFLVGTYALTHFLTTCQTCASCLFLVPIRKRFKFVLSEEVAEDEGEEHQEAVLHSVDFNYRDMILCAIAAGMGAWYMFTKNWIANNVFGLVFAIEGIEMIQLNKASIGVILLGLLFFYDIFWVFGTDVMVTVARSFEAPIKVIFPQDFLTHGIFGTNFAMLGLGDIVLPGVFISLMLRLDRHMKETRPETYKSNVYFNVTFYAYQLGLVLTVVVMHWFGHAQPALLYLVPMCLGVPIITSLIRGEFKAFFTYEDHPENKDENDEVDGVDKKDD